jgi:hypothetical protein
LTKLANTYIITYKEDVMREDAYALPFEEDEAEPEGISPRTSTMIDEDGFTLTASALTLNFDLVSDDPAGEIKVLLVKNRPGKEKPGGWGFPTGQVESCESLTKTLERETKNESGFSVREILGKLFVITKPRIMNRIHLFLVEITDLSIGIIEKDEIENSGEPFKSLREILQMLTAVSADGSVRNPNGIYHSHVERLLEALNKLLFSPEELEDPGGVAPWVNEHRDELTAALESLDKEGLLTKMTEEEEAFWQ